MKKQAKIKIVSMVILLLIGASPGWGSPKRVNLNLVLIKGPHSVTNGQVNLMVQNTAYKLSQLNVGIKRVRRLRLSDPFAHLNHLSTKMSYFGAWRSYINNYKFGKNRGFVHFIAPPMIEGAARYAGGIGEFGCVFQRARSFSIGNAINRGFGPSGAVSKMALNSLIMTHELGHGLRANHDESNSNIMHPNGGALVSAFGANFWPNFNWKAKNETGYCH